MHSTERFSTRVENYVKYRPHYPSAVIDLLQSECGLNRESIVADVGSGTGILSELFLKHGCSVHGIEPNREMREAGEKLLRDYSNFKSIDGTAELSLPGWKLRAWISSQQDKRFIGLIATRRVKNSDEF